jgi:MFS transporter, PPP family, 3-phenylpropionic acid transporter
MAAVIAFGYDLPAGFTIFLLVSLAHASTLAPIAPIADAMTLAAAPGRFQYGWVRGGASAAFVVGAVAAGQVVQATGFGGIVCMNGTLLALAAVAALWLPRNALDRPMAPRQANVRALFAAPGFLPLMALTALVMSSHALHDGFEVLRWEDGGIGPGAAGLLWSEGVLAEVVVFVVVGPTLLRWLGPAGSAALAASAGIVRWSVTTVTAWLPAMALVEPLHGLTFALLHLACMQMLSVVVPPALAATAQGIYGGVAVGTMTAIMTLVSGPLYGAFGPRAFWVMALLCAAALPGIDAKPPSGLDMKPTLQMRRRLSDLDLVNEFTWPARVLADQTVRPGVHQRSSSQMLTASGLCGHPCHRIGQRAIRAGRPRYIARSRNI